MSIEQEKMIVESLPSLYPLQEFEEKAIQTILDALPPAQQNLSEVEREEEGDVADTPKLLDQLFTNNQKLLESNQRLININEKLVEVNNGWKDTVDKMFTLLTTPREGPKKGKWITGVEAAGEKGFACDQCKTFFPYKYYGETHRFCPHCGADMRREQNEHDGQRDKGMAEKVSAAPTGDTGY